MKQSTSSNIAMVAAFCQDFVLMDEELMANITIKNNLSNYKFWYGLAEDVVCSIEGLMLSNKIKITVPAFMFDIKHKLDVNDAILQAITTCLEKPEMEDD